MQLRAVTEADHAALLAIWQQTPGLCVRDDDAYAPFCAYLARNPGFSLLIEHAGSVIAGVMAGHDGRRGYLQHLFVIPAWQHQGLARQLLAEALKRLAAAGIQKSHVLVLADSASARAFWQAQAGWQLRDDVQLCSISHGAST